jgi:hypothetical protein
MPNTPSVIPLIEAAREDGRGFARKIVGNDKLLNPQGAIANNSITQAMMTNASIGQAQLRYETVQLAFGSGDTSKTASVTTGDIVIGVYMSTVTGNPASGAAFVQLSISGTTLTGTLAAAPGGATAVTYTVVLLKT